VSTHDISPMSALMRYEYKGTHRWAKVRDGYRCKLCPATKRSRRDKVPERCITEGRAKDRYGFR
jgi:hypothetical protein